MKEIKACVRRDRVHEVLKAIGGVGAARILVCHVHSIGAGVDPDDFRISFEEGTTYTEKSKVEVICRDGDVDGIVNALARAARTGQPGDGIVLVSDVERFVEVRTGDEGALALP